MRLGFAFFLLFCFQSLAFSQETNIPCKDLTDVARSVMMVRQSGVPMEKATSLVMNGLKEKSPQEEKILAPVYQKIVELAYQQQQKPTNRERLEEINNFAKSIFNRCARRLPKG